MSELWQRMTHLPRRVAIGMVVGASVVGYGMGLAVGWAPTTSGPTRGTAGGGIGVTPAPITTPAPRQTPVFFGPPNAVAPKPAGVPPSGKHGARRGSGRDDGGDGGGWKHGGEKHSGGHGGHGHGGGHGK